MWNLLFMAHFYNKLWSLNISSFNAVSRNYLVDIKNVKCATKSMKIIKLKTKCVEYITVISTWPIQFYINLKVHNV